MIKKFFVSLGLTYVRNFLKKLIEKSFKKIANRGLRSILHFLDENIMFVYPPRPGQQQTDPRKVILPRMATEDFLAINNVLSAFLKIRWHGNASLRSSKAFGGESDRERDLIFICSPRTNDGTKLALEALTINLGTQSIPEFMEIKKGGEVQCHIRFGKEFFSETYEVIKKCVKKNQDPVNANMVDYGMIIKARNPWASEHQILILAGIRGIGTWGAAEFLKKEWRNIYDVKRKDGRYSKKGDFAAIIKVEFNNCDLVNFKLVAFKDLDGTSNGIRVFQE